MKFTRRPARAGSYQSIAEFFDHRNNSLNLVRLILASAVIFWHSFPVTNRDFPVPRLAQLFGDFSVDGFFAISGFLLTGSWLFKPRVWSYVKNRFLRIMPAFWMCLILIAFGVAPIVTAIRGDSVRELFLGSHSAQRFVLENALLKIRFWDVAGTPVGVPYPGVWNGSLWTLFWEALAYVGLLFLGITTLLRRRVVVAAILGLLWIAGIGLQMHALSDNYYTENGTRLGFMFVAGMVLQLYADRIPSSRWCAALAAILVCVSVTLPDYRILGGAALAYLVIWTGGAIRSKKFQLKDRDISYGIYIYGFPVQQVLVLAGLASLPVGLFGVIALVLTVPVAICSWVFIERPALRLKGMRRGSSKGSGGSGVADQATRPGSEQVLSLGGQDLGGEYSPRQKTSGV